MKHDLGVLLRGALMGAADVVPGVSGGTMALITGIYPKLLSSIASFDLAALRMLVRGDIAGAWNHVNGRFLIFLVLGIGFSILSLAQGILWAMDAHPLPLWSFFWGLIAASAWTLQRQLGQLTWSKTMVLVLAAAIGASFVLIAPRELDPALWMYFGAGFVAICAMILPGVSGSLLLLLMGMYQPVLLALKSFDLLVVAVFATGAASGLMSFSRLLRYLLSRHHDLTLAALTGFLWGSLTMVWPWRSEGDLPIPMFPSSFADAYGDPLLGWCLLAGLVGLILVVAIQARWGHGNKLA
ncbi:MAG: hypothetical protein RI942_180 [Pseudomonadota bacterium]|jgi:putative membrane protein